ncbi:MAG: type VI secretion system contractile sheath large subunit [Gammaproteobacteria bacterium]|nr:type VI secretion system contractile sheath large subunit [Gammaproteobacteria bacterium]
MSSVEEQAQGQPGEVTTEEGLSLLDQAISVTKQTERSRAEELMRTLAEEALKGTVSWDKNLSVTINKAVATIDEAISRQLAEVMHDEKFQKLEGTWRGLNHLVMNSETGTSLKIKMLNVTKRELFKDLDKAVEFDQSQIFKKLYETEYGSPGGEPYGALIGDFEFSNHPEDIDLLTNMSGVAAASFCPFISAPAPSLFGFEDWTEMSKPRDLEKVFDSSEYSKWRSFRESDDARFVNLVMPRTLSRLPYGMNTKPVEAFDYEEFGHVKGEPNHEDFNWMNAAYVMGTTLTQAFAENGWCTAIRGAEGGGKVEGLAAYTFISDDGDVDMKCPTEVGITDRREAELSKLGFLPLCHYKNTDYAVFFGAQTVQKPKVYDNPAATDNAAISARLPYIMATSRIAHYLKIMARDKIGSFMEASDAEKWLNKWIKGYVNANPDAGASMKAKFPLKSAKIEVKEIPGAPGSYNAVAWLQPWLQMEELTTSLRLVARIPQTS